MKILRTLSPENWAKRINLTSTTKFNILKEKNLTLVILDFPALIVPTPLELLLFHWLPELTNYMVSNKQT